MCTKHSLQKGDSLPYAPIYLSVNKFCNNVTCKYAIIIIIMYA